MTQQNRIVALFDQQAAGYDEKWSRLHSLSGALHLLLANELAALPMQARILCVGAGTGAEVVYLAEKFPEWQFTVVEPSTAMLAVFRNRAEALKIAFRCTFHHGFLETLPAGKPFHAATALLVSQFILSTDLRREFFQGIASRLLERGRLISADLAGDMSAPAAQDALENWCRLTQPDNASADAVARMRKAYAEEVAVLPPRRIEEILANAGFARPRQFYQAGLIHAWSSQRIFGLDSA